MFGIKRKQQQNLPDVQLFLAEKKPRYEIGAALAKAALVFVLVYGSIGGFLSAYEIEYQKLSCMSGIFCLSLLLSAVYETRRKWAVNLVHILVFALYVYIAFRKFWVINSGYYAVINRILDEAGNYLGVTGRTEYGLVVESESAAVTGFALFLGMVGTILIHIRLHHKASLWTILLLTLPFYAVPFYFEKTPGAGFMILLFTGYAVVAALQGTDVRERMSAQARDVLLPVLLAAAVFVPFLAFVLPPEGYAAAVRAGAAKKATEGWAADIVQYGLPALFGRGGGGAGVSGGLLSKGFSVTPDYETDLIVRYTPYSYEPVYLKAFTGKDYMGDRWSGTDSADAWMEQTTAARAERYKQDNPDKNGMGWEFDFAGIGRDHIAQGSQSESSLTAQGSQSESGLTAQGSQSESGLTAQESQAQGGLRIPEGQEKGSLAQDGTGESDRDGAGNNASGQGCGVMEVDNAGASAMYEYRPYYTGVVRRGGMSAQYVYYPDVIRLSGVTGETDGGYLIVPVSCKRAVERICRDAGFSGTPREIAAQVRAYFDENYTYTLRPGFYYGSPDYITHFLTESRRGYCAHFASSAVMLLRYMGIPARYAEGYAFTYEDVVLDGTLAAGADYAQYYDGYSPLGTTALVELEVTDSSAHAWVEMYVEGEGWIVFDPTPAAGEEEERISFWEDFLNRGKEAEDAASGAGGVGAYLESAVSGLAYGFLILAAALLSFLAGRRLYFRIREAGLPAGERAKLEYRRLAEHLSRRYPDFAVLRTISEQNDWINARCRRGLSKEQSEMLYVLFFAGEKNNGQEAAAALANRLKALWRARYRLRNRIRKQNQEPSKCGNIRNRISNRGSNLSRLPKR